MTKPTWRLIQVVGVSPSLWLMPGGTGSRQGVGGTVWFIKSYGRWCELQLLGIIGVASRTVRIQ